MEDELIQIWQSSPEEEQVKFDKSRLMIDMQSSLERFDKLVKYGVLVEQSVCFIGIPIFIFYVYLVPFIISKIASVIIAIWLIWYMFRLRRVKALKPNSVNVNYLDYLHQTRTYLQVLKGMSDTALYWYVLPGNFGVLLFLSGPIVEGVLTGVLMITMVTSVVVMAIALYFYVKWITKKLYVERLQLLDELIETMEE